MNERIDVILPFKFRNSNTGCKMISNVGSPNQPKPSAVMVIPNWHADKYSSKSETTRFAFFAFYALPRAIDQCG